MLNSIDAKTLKKMFLAGTKNLASKQDWINELNVFPVPDGDTGTNMTLTLMSAVNELNALTDDATLEEVSKKIASGTLKGARGNSGVIMSQLCRGFVKEIEDLEELDIPVLVSAFDRAQLTAYKAVMKPKEGTILTVAKGIAQKAAALLPEEELSMDAFFTTVLSHAEDVLAATPDMLPVLKEAGVVDSGGQGLLEFIKGAYDAFSGKVSDLDFESMGTAEPVRTASHITAGIGRSKPALASRGKKVDTSNLETSDILYGYCTEFIVNIEKKFTARDEQSFKKYLSSIGDSLVCVSMDNLIKVHVHTNDPGLAIQKGLNYGSLSSIKIDNMREEHNERLFADKEDAEDASVLERPSVNETAAETADESDAETANITAAKDFDEAAGGNADEAAGETGASEVVSGGGDPSSESIPEAQTAPETPVHTPRKEYGFVAVCSGEGLENVFRNMSVDEVIEGGQTMNPSTEDILNVIEKVNADNIYLLPNNSNIILTAEQTKHLCTDKRIIVIPTKTVTQGIAAVINYVPAMSIDENAEHMQEAIQEIKTAEITYAVRDTKINDREIRKDDYMGLGDNGLLTVGKDADEVAFDTVSAMFDDDSEIVTVYYGADTTEERARSIAERIEDTFSDAEVDVVYGGQPIYPYIVSVE